jgi:hypothetical protein
VRFQSNTWHSPPGGDRVAVLEGYAGPVAGLGQSPEGGAAAATSSALGLSPGRAVALGVATGVLVWLITRWLDGRLPGRE